MKESKNAKRTGGKEAKRLANLVQQAIDDGADTVEEIHRSIASLPLDVLERLDVFKETVKDVRKVQDTSIGAIYDLIHKVNREVGKLAQELLERPAAKVLDRPAAKLLERPAARKAAPRRSPKVRGSSAHAR